LFSTQRGGAIGHPGLRFHRTGPDTDKARKPACSRVRTAAYEGGSGGGGSSVVFRLSWRRRLSLAAAVDSDELIATINLIKSTDFKVEDVNVNLHMRVAAAIGAFHESQHA
jgi:hypothetical protein